MHGVLLVQHYTKVSVDAIATLMHYHPYTLYGQIRFYKQLMDDSVKCILAKYNNCGTVVGINMAVQRQSKCVNAQISPLTSGVIWLLLIHKVNPQYTQGPRFSLSHQPTSSIHSPHYVMETCDLPGWKLEANTLLLHGVQVT